MSQITAPTPPQSPTALDETLKRWAGTTALGLAIALAAYAVYTFIQTRRDTKEGDAWISFHEFQMAPRTPNGAGPPLSSVDASIRPWAELEEANRPLREGPLTESGTTTARSRFEALAKSPAAGKAASGILPGFGAQAVVQSIAALEAFEAAHANLVSNPPPAADDRARLVTDAGTIEISFYPEQAPEHVRNFRNLIREGFYQGTKFHRISNAGIHIIQGGDPNSKEGAPETWGQGTHGDGIPVERNGLIHKRGVVAMAQPSVSAGAKKSSGCQFYIVTADSHSLNRNYTVFGVVTAGMDVVDKIAASEVEAGTERPKLPTVITQTSIF